MAVLETRPATGERGGISVLETDLEVDFAPPVGYVEPARGSGTSTPRGGPAGLPAGGTLHNQGTMAQAINYSSIAPSASTAAAGSAAVSSNFLTGGQRLSNRRDKAAQAPTPKPSTPVPGASGTAAVPVPPRRATNGPQPLRLPPGKLFFGYEIKPAPARKADGGGGDGDDDKENTGGGARTRFEGAGQTLRAGTKRKGGDDDDAKAKDADAGKAKAKDDKSGQRLGGRTLR